MPKPPVNKRKIQNKQEYNAKKIQSQVLAQSSAEPSHHPSTYKVSITEMSLATDTALSKFVVKELKLRDEMKCKKIPLELMVKRLSELLAEEVSKPIAKLTLTCMIQEILKLTTNSTLTVGVQELLKSITKELELLDKDLAKPIAEILLQPLAKMLSELLESKELLKLQNKKLEKVLPLLELIGETPKLVISELPIAINKAFKLSNSLEERTLNYQELLDLAIETVIKRQIKIEQIEQIELEKFFPEKLIILLEKYVEIEKDEKIRSILKEQTELRLQAASITEQNLKSLAEIDKLKLEHIELLKMLLLKVTNTPELKELKDMIKKIEEVNTKLEEQQHQLEKFETKKISELEQRIQVVESELNENNKDDILSKIVKETLLGNNEDFLNLTN